MKTIKNLLSTTLLIMITMNLYSQTNNKNLFKNHPSHTPPAIFIASMPPCLIGVANQYGNDLGISKNTLQKAKEFIAEAKAEVPKLKKQIRTLEISILKASQEERYNDYEKLLHELSNLKIKASLFHESLVKRARKEFDKNDIKKLDQFIFDNKDEFLKGFKL